MHGDGTPLAAVSVAGPAQADDVTVAGPAQAACEIDSLESILGLLKRLQKGAPA
jgi:hypothetical protein